MKGWSLEARVGILILCAVGLLSAFVYALGGGAVVSATPQPRAATPSNSQVELRMHEPDGFELRCVPTSTLICRCEPAQ